jgi:hypothetical protein
LAAGTVSREGVGSCAADALRHRDEHRSHARGGGAAVLGYARADPADRGEGVAEADASEPVAGDAELFGSVRRERQER